MTAFTVEDQQLATDQGIAVALRRLSREADHTSVRPPVLILTGFGRPMCDLATVAAFVSWAGPVTYRFDPPFHVGISQGAIDRFTLSGYYEALECVLERINEIEGDTVEVIAFSIGLRVALRAIARKAVVSRAFGVSGVVDLRATLHRALGYDPDAPVETLPEASSFQGHTVYREPFLADLHDHAWLAAENAADCQTPLTLVAGTDDEWVTLADYEAFCEGWGGPSETRVLAHIAHDIGKHRTAFLRLMDELATWSLDMPEQAAKPVAAPIAAVIQHAVSERRADRDVAEPTNNVQQRITRR
jgi:alpha-beta hydrolase superfamily lysophospholipase